jgi:hypothetical protein
METIEEAERALSDYVPPPSNSGVSATVRSSR